MASDFIRLKANNSNEWIELIKIAYVSETHQNLLIYAAEMKDLKGVTKIKKDFKLLLDENLMKEEVKEETKEEEYPKKQSEDTTKSDDTAVDDNAKDEKDEDEPNVIEEDFEFVEKDRPLKRSSTLYSRESDNDWEFEDFVIKKVLGIGSFGKVYLVENQVTGKLHAMKSIKKEKIMDYNKMESMKLEEHILLNSEHPNIVSLDYVFKNEERIYFVMNFVRGGELFKQIIDCRRFEESRAKFYAAQIALALGHLHSQDVLYRDLKPENILLGEDGYVYLTDFGLSRILARDEIATSFWGTAEYLAPEMVTSTGHNFGIDWWALGILIYEMIVGIPPFYHKKRDHMFYLIKEAEIKYPDPEKHGISVSEQAQDLINKLLNKDMDKRLGVDEDVEEILDHPWFSDLDMDKILAKEVVPPFKPWLEEDKYDTSNFDPSVTWMDARESE